MAEGVHVLDGRRIGAAATFQGRRHRAVADVSCFDDEDDVFGDVGRMIANAFEVPGKQHQIDRGFDSGGVANHIGQQLAYYLIP